MIDRVRILREGTASWEPHSTRPATVADLVDALIAEGGEIVATEILNVESSPMRVLLVAGPSGRYLVYGPIPAEEETTT